MITAIVEILKFDRHFRFYSISVSLFFLLLPFFNLSRLLRSYFCSLSFSSTHIIHNNECHCVVCVPLTNFSYAFRLHKKFLSVTQKKVHFLSPHTLSLSLWKIKSFLKLIQKVIQLHTSGNVHFI